MLLQYHQIMADSINILALKSWMNLCKFTQAPFDKYQEKAERTVEDLARTLLLFIGL